LKKSPSTICPFALVDENDQPGEIKRNAILYLVNRPGLDQVILPPGRHPVQVTDETPRSFTLTALPGHFAPPGSTISFEMMLDSAGSVMLIQRGDARGSASSLIITFGPALADIAWRRQADAMRFRLQGHINQAERGIISLPPGW
jgi:hypothetical protein